MVNERKGVCGKQPIGVVTTVYWLVGWMAKSEDHNLTRREMLYYIQVEAALALRADSQALGPPNGN